MTNAEAEAARLVQRVGGLREQAELEQAGSSPRGSSGAPEEKEMPISSEEETKRSDDFIESLSSFSRLHRAQRWEGTFGEFLTDILPANPAALARSSHEYIWDMLRWHGRAADPETPDSARGRELFRRELFGIDEPLSRVADYFK